ncbi:HD domain-containing phosphohydrolase [Rhizobium glycinendophyticum]|uniref:Response regulator n=1 Tax=Rhizobium glycinendophyticum TaxID=2589807 RepID=A0A504TTN0_9HYPH|nr:HD domain-containing phosphohydrolase [Rhizobium glycinendophyticum]TPP05499.1 response regulator [Rhizobium glycinendophyticum]
MRIFAIDDSPSILSFIKRAIAAIDSCEILPFLDPSHALAVLRSQQADLILVDYNMPSMNGIELILQFRQLPKAKDVPVIMLTSETDPTIKLAAIEAGVTEFLNKPIDQAEFGIRVRNLLSLRLAQQALAERAEALEKDVATARARIAVQEKEIIWRLSKAMACRDGETALHLERVAVIARMVAEELGIDAATCEKIYLASPLHDVGKIGVSDSVLLKSGPLDARELDEMRAHAAFGAEILEGSDSEIIRIAATIAGSHHEKWDGTGYPQKLAADRIPIEGRIVAIADVFDALCSERPYKKAWPVDEAHREILRGSGNHFDPACVAAFDRRWASIRPLYAKTSAHTSPAPPETDSPSAAPAQAETALETAA